MGISDSKRIRSRIVQEMISNISPPLGDCVAIGSREKIKADPPEVYKSARGQRGG